MTVFVYHTLWGVKRSQFANLFHPSGILQVYASTAPGQCHLQGSLVTVGSGIAGYRDDSFIHPPTSGTYVTCSPRLKPGLLRQRSVYPPTLAPDGPARPAEC
jgi:hypothetical protein